MALVVPLFVQQTVAPHTLSEPMSEIVFGLGYGTLPIPLELRWFATDCMTSTTSIRRTIVYAVLTAGFGLRVGGRVADADLGGIAEPLWSEVETIA